MTPGLLPLLTFPLSFIQSWHCTVMCGPFYSVKSSHQKNLYLLGRTISYSIVGAICGKFGYILKSNLELQVIGGIAFLIFVFFSIYLLLHWLNKKISSWKFQIIPSQVSQKIRNQSALAQGLFSSALPCSLLYQVYSLCILSNSIIGGFLIGLAHASTSTIGLWGSSVVSSAFIKKFSFFKIPLQIGIFALTILNILFFAGVLFYGEQVAQQKILFCF